MRILVRRLCVYLVVFQCFCNVSAQAMNMNLAVPYGTTPSVPPTSILSFYSPQSSNMLFTSDYLTAKTPQLEFVCQVGLRSVGLKWTLHRNRLSVPFLEGDAEALPANQYRIQFDPKDFPAGFYDLKVTLDTGANGMDGEPATGICTFGWNADKMAVRDTMPKDFKKMWDDATAAMGTVALDAKQESPMTTYGNEDINAYNVQEAGLPADYDPTGHKTGEVESCKIGFAGPDGGSISVWMAKPVGDGPFPAMLVLPGAGDNARPRPLEHARHGYLAIDLQVHGHDAEQRNPNEPPYDPGHRESDPEYYSIHMRVEQAINYLVSRPDVDPKRIVVVGGSQGGRLGIVAAGLDSRIAAVVACISHAANYPEDQWVKRMNEQPKRRNDTKNGMDLTEAPPAVTDNNANSFAYYDPMNYAPFIKCPVLMNAGLIDTISPPSNVWAIYNRLGTTDKTIVPLPGMGHDWSAEFDRRAWRWLDEKLKK